MQLKGGRVSFAVGFSISGYHAAGSCTAAHFSEAWRKDACAVPHPQLPTFIQRGS